MDLTAIPPFIQIITGAAVGAIGAYMAIRERLLKLETKFELQFANTFQHIGNVEKTAVRAHERMDVHLAEQAKR